MPSITGGLNGAPALDAVDYGGASTELLRAGFKTCSAGLAFDGRVQGCWGVSPSFPT